MALKRFVLAVCWVCGRLGWNEFYAVPSAILPMASNQNNNHREKSLPITMHQRTSKYACIFCYVASFLVPIARASLLYTTAHQCTRYSCSKRFAFQFFNTLFAFRSLLLCARRKRTDAIWQQLQVLYYCLENVSKSEHKYFDVWFMGLHQTDHIDMLNEYLVYYMACNAFWLMGHWMEYSHINCCIDSWIIWNRVNLFVKDYFTYITFVNRWKDHRKMSELN